MYNLFLEDIPSDLELVGDIAIDTETLGLQFRRDRLCLVQIADSNGKVVLVKYSGSSYNSPNLVRLIEDERRVKIFHYARFDVLALMYYLGIKKIHPIFCTKVASKLTRTYTDSHGLKTICKDLLSVELDKESQSTNWSSKNLTEKQLKYAVNDVLFLHRLRDILKVNLQNLQREDIADSCFNFIHHISQMEIAGFDFINILSH